MDITYLGELLKEKNALATFPGFFVNAERLVDTEIARMRGNIFHSSLQDDLQKLPSPEPFGEKVTLQEKVYVPVKDHPDFNFVGRILGPRGMTAKQLEHETGCKIMVRGKGSLRSMDKDHRGKLSLEHLDDELHILIQCEDTENRARAKLAIAVDNVKKLLVPAPGDGIDELKRKQLMELSIINGTYRPSAKKTPPPNLPRLMPLSLLSPIRPPSASPSFFHRSMSSGYGYGSPLPSPMKEFGSACKSTSAAAAFSADSAFEFNDLIKQLTSMDTTAERSFRQHQQYRAERAGRPIEGMPPTMTSACVEE